MLARDLCQWLVNNLKIDGLDELIKKRLEVCDLTITAPMTNR